MYLSGPPPLPRFISIMIISLPAPTLPFPLMTLFPITIAVSAGRFPRRASTSAATALTLPRTVTRIVSFLSPLQIWPTSCFYESRNMRQQFVLKKIIIKQSKKRQFFLINNVKKLFCQISYHRKEWWQWIEGRQSSGLFSQLICRVLCFFFEPRVYQKKPL